MHLLTTYSANAFISAGFAVTLLHLQLTVNPREPWQASTRIAALSCVHAGGAIHTWMVMGAEVKICGREEFCLPGA